MATGTTQQGDPVKEAFEALYKKIAAIPAKDRDSGQRQFMRAHALERVRSDVMEGVNSNRTYLRLMEKNGELSDELADWLADYYADKEAGEQRTEEQIAATRKAKEVARKMKLADAEALI